ncbi:hypothetical protein [Lysobacter silvisoli]|uniref:Uncharacterized protein n=1 Tax=Lysobacter silvisoli TaxID=2293254 RepID=A0A371K3M9_9GAMM|nr:hypothetical protein [Lysobacter silvisoli]RDZ28447.1 hypothetical protein DX914_04750 [Lysobacter silvisoli]
MITPARALLTVGLLLLAVGWFKRNLEPEPAQLLPVVNTEPGQHPSSMAPFSVRAGEVEYRIEPVAEYDIAGLIVSRHDSDTWWDKFHARNNDHLNVADLCLAWGANTADGVYRHMKFWNGQWTCNFQWGGGAPVGPQHTRAVSNNHLLTNDPLIAERIRSLRVGDQVRLRGQLAVYRHNHGMNFVRGTSTNRDDGGNGACETLFVRQLDLLQAAPSWPRTLRWIGAVLLALGLIAWYRAPFKGGH